MDADPRAALLASFLALAESFAATAHLLEQARALLLEELAREAPHSSGTYPAVTATESSNGRLVIDDDQLTVTYRGRSCYLGNTLPFRLLARLARRPNRYFTHVELLDYVWKGARTTDAIRSVVKTLRQKLRQDGLDELAAAIDGSAPGRYALKLPA
jgi:DNA-binding response OmpR family regulator